MTTKIMKRKQKPNGTECPVSGKKPKTSDEANVAKQQPDATKRPPVSRVIKKRKINGKVETQDDAKAAIKYAENFRTKLQTGVMAMSAIRHFLQEAYTNHDLVEKYIRAGGTFKPIMDILSACEKDKLNDIADVLHLVQLVMIQSLHYDDTHANYAAKNARAIMSDYQTVICGLLQAQGDHAMICKASALRILRAILLVDCASYWRDILKLVDVSMSKMDMANCRESAVVQEGMIGDSLRTVFIEFNLAFLIDTPLEMVRMWLARPAMMHSLVVNLVFDHSENVILVMKTLQQYVLGNADIDKYNYRTAFTPDILKGLVNVYEWVGPEKQATSERAKLAVLNATEEFVYPLLTSRRCFLVPKSIDLERASPRYRQLLQGLKHTQLSEHQRKLAIGMLKMCPEVLPAALDMYGALLKFPAPENRELVKQMLLLHKPAEMIAALEPGVSAKALSSFVVKGTLPRTVLNHIRDALETRKESIPYCFEFLVLMVTRCEEYIQEIERCRTLDQFGLKKVKVDAINHILAVFPPVDRIMAAMTSHRMDRDTFRPEVALEQAMDILLVCIRCFPAYIESSSFITTYRDILQPTYRSATVEHFFLSYEFKAIKVVIALEPQSVSFESPLFPSVLKLLTKVYLNGQASMKRDATDQLLALFRNTALFDNRGTEIEFWFQAMNDIDPETVSDLVQYLAQQVALAAQSVSHKTSSKGTTHNHTLIDEAFEVETTERQYDLEELFARVEQDADEATDGSATVYDAQVQLPVTDNFFVYMFGSNTIRPKHFQRYFDGVALRYLHYLPHPEIVARALNASAGDIGKKLSASIKIVEYTREWLAGNECSLGEPEQWKQFCKLSDSFVAKDRSFILDEKTMKCWKNTRSVLLNLFHQTLFFLSRLVVSCKLTPAHLELATHYTHLFLEHLLKKNVLTEREVDELLAGIFLQRPVLFQHFTLVAQEDDPIRRLVTEFVCGLMQKLHHLPRFDRYTALYSNKIVTELMRVSLDATKAQLDGVLTEKLLGIFKLNERNCVTLLRHYAQLPVGAFVNGNHHTCHFSQLCFALNQLGAKSRQRKEHILPEDTVRGLVRIYMECGRLEGGSEAVELEQLESALHAYLSTFTHSIAYVDPALMRGFLDNSRRIGKPLVKLACFLLARSVHFQEPFLEVVGDQAAKKELVFPLLNVAFRQGILTEAMLEDDHGKQLLMQLYKEFKGPILKMLEKPNKAAVIYRENALASQMLVRLCMPRNECVDFARKKLRIEAVESFQLKALMEIYGVAMKTLEDGDVASQQTVYCNGFAVLLQCFEVMFKSISSAQYLLQQGAHLHRLNELVLAMYRWTKQLPRKQGDSMSFTSVTGSASWNTFCKTCLKFGIDTPRTSEHERRYDERLHVLPKLMAVLVGMFYTDNTPEQTDIERYYDWALTHSNFMRVFLLQHQYKPKTALVQLMYVLACKNPTVANNKHVPLLLGAYGATLSDANRYLLALLQHYERSGVQMHEFRPFLWGETAIKHFSLEAGVNGGEEPGGEAGGARPASGRTSFRTNLAEVFYLLSADKVTNTIEQYPVWRKLDACAQLPAINFDELSEQEQDGLKVAYQPTSQVERFVEHSLHKKHRASHELLEMHDIRAEMGSRTYDPAFLVPMLNYLYSNEHANMLNHGIRMGLLALPFVCLSSTDEQMQLAAGSVIVRIQSQLELTNRFIDSKFWLHLFATVQRGFEAIHASNVKRASNKQSRPPRVPFLSMIFIAETIKVLPNVLSKLHGPMTRHVLRQKVYNFRMVPNFLPLFNSNIVENNVHRMFMIRTLCLGVKSHKDFAVLRASPIINVMMGFHGSPLSNRELDQGILKLIAAMVQIPKSCQFLVDSLGFLGWLGGRIDATESFHFDTIESLVGLLSSSWYSMQLLAGCKIAQSSTQKSHARASVFFQRSVLILTLKFLPLLSTRSSSSTLIRLLNLLDKTTSPRHGYQHLMSIVSTEVLQQLMDYFENLFSEHMWCVRYVRQCGASGSDDDATVGKTLQDSGLDQTSILIVLALRRFVIRWCVLQKESPNAAVEDEEQHVEQEKDQLDGDSSSGDEEDEDVADEIDDDEAT
ncbi:uncharacterized protein LOC128728340 [Anopheles nili]|uniref:uncharacterized protein LOC128728340 n=1 Tax=Anopheles nili TaxID=185578 RepID=UPI00237AF8EF|nr:uncharacterized protein LOC128728340 [Anopheles nili]